MRLLVLSLATLLGGSVRDTGVDVAVAEPPMPHRYVVLEYDASQLSLDKYRGNLVIMPIEHHALYLSGFSAHVTTAPVAVEFDIQDNGTKFATEQTFDGYGGEIGYRYYTGLAGPRGLFVGPSFVLGKYHQRSGDGSTADFSNRGVALDLGYAALIAHRVALSVAGGVQWTATSITLPEQFFPANWLVNEGFRARFLLSIGVAL